VEILRCAQNDIRRGTQNGRIKAQNDRELGAVFILSDASASVLE
jgi:hypothetical protein